MLWFWLAFGSALSESLNYVVSKKALMRVEPMLVSLSLSLFAIPWLLLASLAGGEMAVNDSYWLLVLGGGALYGMGRILFVEAINASPLSITVPMGAFAPIFLLISSPIVLGEFPNVWGLVGVLFAFAGSYALNISRLSEGYLAPFKALLKEKGPRLMLMTAFLWSLASVIDKLGVQTARPAVWVLGLNVVMTAFTLVYCAAKGGLSFSPAKASLGSLFLIGAISATTLLLYVSAVQFALVAYASAVKRFSPLFSVVFGWVFFNEKGIAERFAGAFLMVTGAVLIVAFG